MGQLSQQLFVYLAAGGQMSGKRIIHVFPTTTNGCIVKERATPVLFTFLQA